MQWLDDIKQFGYLVIWLFGESVGGIFLFFCFYRSFLLTTKRNEPKKSRQPGRERCQKLAVLVSAALKLASLKH